jgi:hypothetical protein
VVREALSLRGDVGDGCSVGVEVDGLGDLLVSQGRFAAAGAASAAGFGEAVVGVGGDKVSLGSARAESMPNRSRPSKCSA